MTRHTSALALTWACAVALVPSLLLGGCGSPTEAARATTMARFRDRAANANVGTADSVGVKVTDQKGKAYAGAVISFAVTAGNGTVSQSSVTTTSLGTAVVAWTLGNTPGAQTVTATAASLAGSPILFTVNALAGPAALVTKVGADPATLTAASAFDSIRVIVTDQVGNPKAGEAVTFSIVTGGGSVSPTAVTTGADGRAAARWTAGTVALQVNSVAATRAGLTPAIFSTVISAGPATQIAKVGVDPTSVPAGSSIDSIRAIVTDQFGNGKSGELVSFAVTAGGGSVSPSTVTTGLDGRAAARWNVGTTVSVLNSATATRTGFPVITYATTTANVPASVVLTSPRIIVVDLGATATVTFVARDGAGNVMPGAPLSSVSRGPAAAYVNGTVSGLARGQTFIVVSSTVNTLAKDSVLVIVKSPNAPVLTTNLDKTDFAPNSLVSVTVLADMRSSPEKLGAATLLITWNPSQLTYVSNVDGTSGVGATVNTANVTSGSLALTLANSTGFAGNVELRQLTFRTAAQVGLTGTLSLLPTELTAASTFNNLLSSTVSAFFPLVIR